MWKAGLKGNTLERRQGSTYCWAVAVKVRAGFRLCKGNYALSNSCQHGGNKQLRGEINDLLRSWKEHAWPQRGAWRGHQELHLHLLGSNGCGGSGFTSVESFHVVVQRPEHETLEVKSCPHLVNGSFALSLVSLCSHYLV